LTPKVLKLARCPRSLAATLAACTLITRTACARASYPSCVAVYPRDPRSRRVLCRATHALHSVHAQILDHLPVVIAIFFSATRVKESFHIFARVKLVG